MRGDQLARQWRIIWSIEASRNRLAIAEIARREETGIGTNYWELEFIQAAGFLGIIIKNKDSTPVCRMRGGY